MVHESYEPVIGLEVHCQLQTQSKLFSPDPAAYGAAPNTHVDPISLGHPGTLPVLNERAVEYALRLGLATHAKVSPRSGFARKHYFYPDLPKGYQITQHDAPLCYDGYVEIRPVAGRAGGDGRAALRSERIGLARIHLEEDAGRSLHDDTGTRVDYNRCGVPLVEIVTAPDLRAPREAFLFLQKIRQLVRYLGISSGNMDEGALRCDANVSVRRYGSAAYGPKVELKNMNALRGVEQALDYETARQIALVERGQAVTPETRRWDAEAMKTRPLRAKETAADYRYLPDPDLPPIVVEEARLKKVRAALPEQPATRRGRFAEEYGLPPRDAARLTEERAVADYFEETVSALFKHTKGGDTQAQAKAVANMITNSVLRVLNGRPGEIGALRLTPKRLAALAYLRLEDEISATGARKLFSVMLDEDGDAEALARQHGLLQVSDEGALSSFLDEMLERHAKNVQRYLDGKKSLMRFFVGQAMAHFDSSPDPSAVRRMLEKKLEARRS